MSFLFVVNLAGLFLGPLFVLVLGLRFYILMLERRIEHGGSSDYRDLDAFLIRHRYDQHHCAASLLGKLAVMVTFGLHVLALLPQDAISYRYQILLPLEYSCPLKRERLNRLGYGYIARFFLQHNTQGYALYCLEQPPLTCSTPATFISYAHPLH